MIYPHTLQGKYVILQSVCTEDADFISKLRSDETLCRHLHRVDTSIEGQISWINFQREQEDDCYFLIKSINGVSLGTIALYHIKESAAEIGRWVSYGNAFENMEAVILIHDFAFEILHLDLVYTCTNISNEKVKSFWRRFGGDRTYIEEEEDFVASKNEITYGTYQNFIRPEMIKMLRY